MYSRTGYAVSQFRSSHPSFIPLSSPAERPGVTRRDIRPRRVPFGSGARARATGEGIRPHMIGNWTSSWSSFPHSYVPSGFFSVPWS